MFKNLLFNLKYWWWRKHNELSPKGECFAQYCRNILESRDQATIEDYELTIEQVIDNLSKAGISVTRADVAEYFCDFLYDQI